VTWRPRSGVRIAAVVVAWKGGFVLAGRSLRRVEEQEASAELIAGAAWLVMLAALVLAAIVAAWFWPEARPDRG
jgi:membrane protein DedA with SNARE-associated domain